MKKTNLSDYSPSTVPNGAPWTIAVVAAEWNPEVTNAMLKGAVETLLLHGVKEDNIIVHRVPGTYELSYAADTLAELDTIDAVICIGCVIQGETRHFDFICEAVFSVLTTDTMQQALDRAGGQHGNKGVEGAITALKMLQFTDQAVF